MSRYISCSRFQLAVAFSAAFSLPHLGAAATLYSTHYATNSVSTLSFGGSSLTVVQSLKACGPFASWLTYEDSTKEVYCSGENSPVGSLSSFGSAADGQLTLETSVNAAGSGVSNVLYGGSDGKGFIAIAHYDTHTVSTFKLPLTSSSTALQTLTYTLAKPGPNPSRQDSPHPHEVIVDPTGKFVLSPDLGADIVRVFSIDASTGVLTQCTSLVSTPGAGPRHAAFWVPKSSRVRRGAANSTKLYVINELSNTVVAHDVAYTSGCLSFTKTQELSPYPDNSPAPAYARTAEIHVKDNFLYTSNRNDTSINGNDSLATFSISSTGALTFQNLSSSYGSWPRTFVINKVGDLVAVGNQVSSTVAIIKRDPKTGVLGDLVTSLKAGPEGIPGQNNGLSSVVFAE